jgi:hypothetical protein
MIRWAGCPGVHPFEVANLKALSRMTALPLVQLIGSAVSPRLCYLSNLTAVSVRILRPAVQ